MKVEVLNKEKKIVLMKMLSYIFMSGILFLGSIGYFFFEKQEFNKGANGIGIVNDKYDIKKSDAKDKEAKFWISYDFIATDGSVYSAEKVIVTYDVWKKYKKNGGIVIFYEKDNLKNNHPLEVQKEELNNLKNASVITFMLLIASILNFFSNLKQFAHINLSLKKK